MAQLKTNQSARGEQAWVVTCVHSQGKMTSRLSQILTNSRLDSVEHPSTETLHLRLKATLSDTVFWTSSSSILPLIRTLKRKRPNGPISIQTSLWHFRWTIKAIRHSVQHLKSATSQKSHSKCLTSSAGTSNEATAMHIFAPGLLWYHIQSSRMHLRSARRHKLSSRRRTTVYLLQRHKMLIWSKAALKTNRTRDWRMIEESCSLESVSLSSSSCNRWGWRIAILIRGSFLNNLVKNKIHR